MTAGESMALLVEGRDAIRSLRYLVGPTQQADTFAPQSIRARFGTNMAENAAHASDAVGSAIRYEIWRSHILTVRASMAFDKLGGGLIVCDTERSTFGSGLTTSAADRELQLA